MVDRFARRRLRFALATLMGVRRRGFFIPYRHADQVAPRAYPALAPRLATAIPSMIGILDTMDSLAPALGAIHGPAPQPRWDQDWFPGLDAAALYTIVRQFRPARIVEIGSGHSTRFMARAVADAGLATEIVCIDPAPRASLERLAVHHERRTLGDDTSAVAAMLGPGDILFVDSSHLAVPGSDVDHIVNDLLPRLPQGVLVHLHDIFLPDPYPAAWEPWGYGEQLLIAALLQGNGYAVRFASHWLRAHDPGLLQGRAVGRLPLVAGAKESSLWLEKGC